MPEYSRPASVASSRVATGQRVVLMPPFRKLTLRDEAALAEEAAARDHDAVRLRLATLASLLFDELYLIERKLAVNDAHRELLAELREIAVARYEAGAANQQDPLEAELEEAELLHRDVALRADLRIAAEQLNVLLHRSPELPRPPLPAALEAPAPESAPRETLLARAVAERPELRAAEARVRAREAAVDLARREYLPDLRLMGAYDSFWEESELQPTIGLELNLPLRRARRAAALDEAKASLEQARSTRAGLDDQVRFPPRVRSNGSPRRTMRLTSSGTTCCRRRAIASILRAHRSRRGRATSRR
jgi:outer membrane protein TolC